MSAPRSVILITVDCLRADHVGFLGYDRPTTPFLDTVAAGSLTFSNAIVAGAPTYYSFPAIMASRYPLALGRDVIGLAPHEPTIASILNESGYATAAILAGNPYLSPRFGYDAGFESFESFLDAESSPVPDDAGESTILRRRSHWNLRLAKACHGLGPLGPLYDELYFQYRQRLAVPPIPSLDVLRRFPSADVIVDRAREWLSGIASRPFFLWLHFMDPHAPYYPSEKALEWMGNGNLGALGARYLNSYWNRGDLGASRLRRHREDVIALYDAGIRWVDAQIGRLVDALRESRLWDNCVLALTADHGEEFLDHGGRYHSPSKVTEELIHVPLLLHAPEVGKRQSVKSTFSLLDLAPTLLDAVDISIPGSFRGRSRCNQLRNEQSWEGPAVIECVTGCTNPFRVNDRLSARILAVRESRYKLLFDFATSTQQLFDLEADRHELRALPADAEKPVRRRLLDRARGHIADSVRSRNPDLRLGARLHDLQLEWLEPTAQISA
jgi:arylsulfatase A-like enzyme